MFGILISALNTLLGFVFRSLIIKFVVFFALYFVVQGFVEILVELLPDSSNLSSLFANLSDGFWYFINLSKLPQGISMIISAMATRFIIRRIPVIGCIMAISAYIGIPGSGKSYEAVCNVIIPAFTSGRRVVTNIYGLQKDKITERYPDATGEIIVVDNDDVLKADFFPFKGGEGSFCQFGDLIVIDEAWRIFGSDKDMTAEKKSFIAEHRHFTHPETGISCDLVIVNQSLSNIARFLKDKIETTYRMRKLKALGLNNHYCSDVYSGHKIYKSNLVTSYRNKYNPDIFELYKSYEGNNGNEKQTDKRQSIWNSGKVRFFLVLFPLMFIGSGWLIYSFFSTFGRSEPSPDLTTTDVRDAAMFRSSAATPAPDTPSEPAEPPLSTEWRISGRMTSEGRAFVILVNGAGVLRAVPASSFNYKGMLMSGIIDGERVTLYTGKK